MPVAEYRTIVPVPLEELFAWHERRGAIQRLIPPWVDIRVVRSTGSIRDGIALFQIEQGPFEIEWEAHHTQYVENEFFVDEQARGPFDSWKHTHKFRRVTDTTSEVHDIIAYDLPVPPFGQLTAGWYVRRQLDRMFRFRHRRTKEDVSRHHARANSKRLRVLISGASGMVGSALCAFLTTGGHTVVRLVRSQAEADSGEGIYWEPIGGKIDHSKLEGFDAIVHLAGENIAGSRWTPEVKERIRLSRVNGTTTLAAAISRLQTPPSVFISASAIGYYGNRADTPVLETSEPGEGFLPDVCREWEEATVRARTVGVRVVNLRIGTVISPAGGALKKMLPAFSAGVGGPIGDGRQYMSWITLNDLVGVIHHALFDARLLGPVNAVSPNPVTNKEFAAILGRVLRRPALIPTPAGAIKLLFGEMGERLVLEGARVLPRRLTEAGFEFCSSDLEDGLREELGL